MVYLKKIRSTLCKGKPINIENDIISVIKAKKSNIQIITVKAFIQFIGDELVDLTPDHITFLQRNNGYKNVRDLSVLKNLKVKAKDAIANSNLPENESTTISESKEGKEDETEGESPKYINHTVEKLAEDYLRDALRYFDVADAEDHLQQAKARFLSNFSLKNQT